MGELTQRTFDDYKRTTDHFVSTFGARRLVEDLAAEERCVRGWPSGGDRHAWAWRSE